jgi:class 3 adenylate cyclase
MGEDLPVLRLSDAEREDIVAVLRLHTGEGRLTLDEFAERAERVYGAQTKSDLEPLVRDLPDLHAPQTAVPIAPPEGKRKTKYILGIMSGPRRKGRWHVPEHITAVGFWGGVELDLREAIMESRRTHIRAFALMGGVTVIVPEGAVVDVDGFVLMGGLEDRTKRSTDPSGPTIVVHGYGMWGGIVVRTKAPGERRHRHGPPPLPPMVPGLGHADDQDHWQERQQERQARQQERQRQHQQRHGRQWPPAPPVPPAAPWPAASPPQADDDRSLIDLFAAEESAVEAPAVAPTGTVTILFTDVCESTQVAERLGDQRWMGVLGAHNALVREQVTRHGGTEVKHHGDGFMVVFPSARRALLCAIGVQRAMASYRDGHPDTPIDVRIGLHTGEVIEESGDYFGRNVILAARIADAAQRGEILASALVKELADSGGDLGFDVGREVELKGMSRPWRVHTVDW